jgi:hypothetical protein
LTAFGEFTWIVERKVAVHFVGADVMESHVMLACRFKQVERTLHIRCDEGFRIGDGVVVVRFGREMHDRVMPGHDTFQ